MEKKLTTKNTIPLPFLAGAKWKDKIYFSAFYTNGLFEIDCRNFECRYVRAFDEVCKMCLYRKAFIDGDEIWFMPWEANRVARYNIITDELIYIDIKNYNINNSFAYWDGYKCERKLFFIPYNMDCPIGIIDLDSKNISFKCQITGIQSDKIAGGQVCGEKNIICLRNGNIVDEKGNVWLDGERENDKRDNNRILSVINDKGSIWLCPFESNYVEVINIEKREKDTLLEIGDNKFSFGKCEKDKAILFPAEKNRKILIYDKKQKKAYNKDLGIADKSSWIELVEIDSQLDGKMILACNLGKIIYYDVEHDIIKYHDVSMKVEEFKENIKMDININNLTMGEAIVENKYIDIDVFIGALSKENIYYGR